MHVLMAIRDALKRLADWRQFPAVYLGTALTTLVASTLYWAYLGARVQLRNADQLVNGLLFDNVSVFRDAVFPVNHTFFIKWPIFYLEKLFGLGDSAYIVVTMLVVLSTVGALAYLLYRIEKRPIVLGTVFLALASTLMLVPIESAPGSLLPVNMAMAATRNLEYIVYIAALVFILQSKSYSSRRFIAGTVILALLFASDKLYLSLSVGGALMGIVLTALFRQRGQIILMVRWLAGSIAAAVIATVIIWALNLVTNISDSSGAGPYQFVRSAHDLVIGIAYGVLHIATNMGANPASQESVLTNIPAAVLQGLRSISGLSYLINGCLLILAIWASTRTAKVYATSRSSSQNASTATLLSLALLLSGIAALGAFVVTEHYYAGDARYLAVLFFALVVSSVTFVSQQTFKPKIMVLAGVLCLLSVICAVPTARQQADASIKAHAGFVSRNVRVGNKAATLQQAQNNEPLILVGDYWRVIPIKQQYDTVRILPLEGCSQAREVLSSKRWYHDRKSTRFVYLLSLDASLTNYPRCSLDQIMDLFGQPINVQVIAGTKENPKELLLYYDKGAESLL